MICADTAIYELYDGRIAKKHELLLLITENKTVINKPLPLVGKTTIRCKCPGACERANRCARPWDIQKLRQDLLSLVEEDMSRFALEKPVPVILMFASGIQALSGTTMLLYADS